MSSVLGGKARTLEQVLDWPSRSGVEWRESQGGRALPGGKPVSTHMSLHELHCVQLTVTLSLVSLEEESLSHRHPHL